MSKIAINASKISINRSKISINMSKISINRSGISINMSKISINRSKISVNMSKISILQIWQWTKTLKYCNYQFNRNLLHYPSYRHNFFVHFFPPDFAQFSEIIHFNENSITRQENFNMEGNERDEHQSLRRIE